VDGQIYSLITLSFEKKFPVLIG